MSETKKNERLTNDADEIWSEIRGLPIQVYALPGQVVSNHIVKIPVPGNELYVKLNSTAVLPALEESLSNTHFTRGIKYELETADGYVIVRRAVDRDALVNKALADAAKKSK